MKIELRSYICFFLISFFILAQEAAAQDFRFEPSPSQDIEIVSIETIIAQTHEISLGNIEEVELKKRHGKWVYEVEILTSDNNKMELVFDATSGTLLSKKHERKKWRMSH